MNISKHILFLVPGFPKDEQDFLCIPPLQDFLISLKKKFLNLKINVIAFHYPYRRDKYSWNKINVFPLNGRNRRITKFNIWNKVYREAMNIHKQDNIDLIHSLWLGECALLGNYISKKIKAKHICTLMGQDVTKRNIYLKLIDLNKLTTVSLSNNQSRQFHSITRRVPNQKIFWGIQDFQFDVNRKREIDLLAVGSLIPLKNYTLFIKTVAELAKYFDNLNCAIIGDGPERNTLQQLTEKLGVKNIIEFKGLTSRNEIFSIMQKSKVLVHPSKFEGSGFAFTEALANGMNIISFNVGYATQNEKWVVAQDDKDFIVQTKGLLEKDLDYHPKNLFPISETVNKYSKFYGLIN